MNTTLIEATRSSIETYLGTEIIGYGNEVKDIKDIPPELDLSLLKDTTIPLVTQKEFTEKVQTISERRNQLLTIVKVDNHDWPH